MFQRWRGFLPWPHFPPCLAALPGGHGVGSWSGCFSPAPGQPRSPRHRHWNRQGLGHMHAGKGCPRHSPQRQMSPGPGMGAGPSQPFLACWTRERGAGTRTGLLSSVVFRQEQLHTKVPASDEGQLLEPPGKWGLSERNNVSLSSDPVAACAFSHGAASELDPPRPPAAAPAAEHQPHPLRLVEVSYLIGNPWPT